MKSFLSKKLLSNTAVFLAFVFLFLTGSSRLNVRASENVHFDN